MKTKEEKIEYDRQYRLNNKEKIKQYRLDNKEKIRLSRIDYDNRNKEKIAEQQREYKSKHREKISEYSREYSRVNEDKIKQYPSNSPEIRKSIYKKYNKENKIKRRNYKLLKHYNITLDQYNEMFNQQDGKCGICGIHQDDLVKKLAVDHNHETNEVRGLLCDKCNRGLGHFNDDLNLLSNAINYLKQ